MSAQPFCVCNTAWREYCATIFLVLPERDGEWESKHAMVRERYGEACGKQVSGMDLRRVHRWFSPSTVPWLIDAVFYPVEKAGSRPSV
jgi:hypothetical protein